MNKRYRELEKKANDARRTYEKLVKKAAFIKKDVDEIGRCRDICIEQADILHEEINKIKATNGYEDMEAIIKCSSELSKYEVNFLEETFKKAKSYAEIFETNNALLNEMIIECKKLKQEIEIEESTFKFQWNKNRACVTENMAMDAIKNSKKKNKEYKNLCKKSFDLLADRDQAKEKYEKLMDKINVYESLRKNYKELSDKYCILHGIDEDDIQKRKEEIVSAINKAIKVNQEIVEIAKLYLKQSNELEKIVSKLTIAKDKLEDAEYQFKEYKSMLVAS